MSVITFLSSSENRIDNGNCPSRSNLCFEKEKRVKNKNFTTQQKKAILPIAGTRSIAGIWPRRRYSRNRRFLLFNLRIIQPYKIMAYLNWRSFKNSVSIFTTFKIIYSFKYNPVNHNSATVLFVSMRPTCPHAHLLTNPDTHQSQKG